MAVNEPETGGQWWRPRWAASWRVYWAKCRGKRLRSRPLRTSRWQTTASRTEWTVGRRRAAGAGCHTHYTQTHKYTYLLIYLHSATISAPPALARGAQSLNGTALGSRRVYNAGKQAICNRTRQGMAANTERLSQSIKL